jgi:hypothetical protein
MLDHIHKSLNMQVFSIAEVREEQWVINLIKKIIHT